MEKTSRVLKGIAIIRLVIVCIVILLGLCATAWLIIDINEQKAGFTFSYDELVDNIEKVEIVYVENYSSGDDKKIEVIKTLDYETSLLLIKDFSEVKYISPFGTPPEPYGECIRLWYKDGNYEIYCSNGTSERIAWCYGEEEIQKFEQIISKYK